MSIQHDSLNGAACISSTIDTGALQTSFTQYTSGNKTLKVFWQGIWNFSKVKMMRSAHQWFWHNAEMVYLGNFWECTQLSNQQQTWQLCGTVHDRQHRGAQCVMRAAHQIGQERRNAKYACSGNSVLDCPTLRCTLQHCTVQLPNLPLTPQELDCFMLSLNSLPQLQQHIMQALLLLAWLPKALAVDCLSFGNTFTCKKSPNMLVLPMKWRRWLWRRWAYYQRI